jgi:hypothetical protein
MLLRKALHSINVFVLLSGLCARAMVYDNPFFPLLPQGIDRVNRELSAFCFGGFYSSGDIAWNIRNVQVGIPELYGYFDLETLAEGMVAMGYANPLPTEWQLGSIPFKTGGKIESVGTAFSWHQRITDQWAFGASWLFMGVQSEQTFRLLTQVEDTTNRTTNLRLGPGDALLLDTIRRQAFTTIGITQNHVSQMGFGDIDAYLQWGDQWEHELKCRSVKGAGRFGILFPSGVTHEPNVPASVPFGGNGHWGVYVSGYGSFEIKEDIFVGALLRISQRFKRTTPQRVSTVGEPSIFGAAVLPVSVSPGVTIICSPFVVLENVRKGFALGCSYTLTKHQADTWKTCCDKAKIIEQLKRTDELSEWGSSYVTLSAQYDFGKVKVQRTFEPILSFRWDWPVELFVTRQVVKSNRISIDLDFVF